MIIDEKIAEFVVKTTKDIFKEVNRIVPTKIKVAALIAFIIYVIKEFVSYKKGTNLTEEIQNSKYWSKLDSSQRREIKEYGIWWDMTKSFIYKNKINNPGMLMEMWNDRPLVPRMDYVTAVALMRIYIAICEKAIEDKNKNQDYFS